MRKAITFDIKGIKCDNPVCGWRNMEVAFDMEYFLNRPCPLCGSNLFTQADYDVMKRMFTVAGFINFFMWPFLWLFRKQKTKQVKIDLNGTGEVKVRDV